MIDMDQPCCFVFSGLAWIQKSSHVQLKTDHGRNPFINPVLWGNNDSTRGGEGLRTVSHKAFWSMHYLSAVPQTKGRLKGCISYLIMQVIMWQNHMFFYLWPYLSGVSSWLAFSITAEISHKLSHCKIPSFCSSLSPLLFYPSPRFQLHCGVVFSQHIMSYGTSAVLIESSGMVAELYGIKHKDRAAKLKVRVSAQPWCSNTRAQTIGEGECESSKEKRLKVMITGWEWVFSVDLSITF